MKVNCAKCQRELPVEDIALDTGWARCRACNEIFPLAELAPSYSQAPTQAVPERPFDAWARIDRQPDRLFIHLPPKGMRAAVWALAGFALFWNGFILFWTLGALGFFFNKGQIDLGNIAFAAFSIPFWIVGLGMMWAVVWMARGSTTVLIDAEWLVAESRCLLLRFRKLVTRTDVQYARPNVKVVRSENGPSQTNYQVEIVRQGGSITLGCDSLDEQNWLVAEINDFLRAVPARASSDYTQATPIVR